MLKLITKKISKFDDRLMIQFHNNFTSEIFNENIFWTLSFVAGESKFSIN